MVTTGGVAQVALNGTHGAFIFTHPTYAGPVTCDRFYVVSGSAG